MIADLVVDAIATYRLTRLVTADTITEPARDSIIEASYVVAGRAERAREEVAVVGWSEYAMHDDDAPKLATLVVCRWCASIWLGAGVVVVRRYMPRAWQKVAATLVFSAVAALAAGLEDR